MRQSIILLITTLIAYTAIAQKTYTYNDQVHLWGPIHIENLEAQPYKEWYTDKKNNQSLTLPIEFFSSLDDVQVTIFIGTWCGDTKRNLPLFIDLWTKAKLPLENLKLMALHNIDSLYKQAPDHIEEKYGIHRVPTFIFEKNGVEIGRMIESPKTSMEIDLAQIAAGVPSTARYEGVTWLQNFFANTSPDSLIIKKKYIQSQVSGKVSSVSELTTYARKLKTEGKLDKAELVYELAMSLFPYHPVPYYYMASFLIDQSKSVIAKALLEKALKIEPEFSRARTMLKEL